MKKVIASFFISFSMYSKIPVPRPEWSKENMRYTMCFFPFIGVVIGGLIVLWKLLAIQLGFQVIFQTVIFLMIPLLVTGGIHLDGLLDTADALSSYQPMERKLEILKDSHAGAFAIIVGIAYFLLSFAAWSEVDTSLVFVLAGGFVLSRALSGIGIVWIKCAKNTGLANTFADSAAKRTTGIVLVAEAVLAIVYMLFVDFILGLVITLSMILFFFYYKWMSYKKFGGITGDLAGFFLQISELIMVLFVVVFEKIIG